MKSSSINLSLDVTNIVPFSYFLKKKEELIHHFHSLTHFRSHLFLDDHHYIKIHMREHDGRPINIFPFVNATLVKTSQFVRRYNYLNVYVKFKQIQFVKRWLIQRVICYFVLKVLKFPIHWKKSIIEFPSGRRFPAHGWLMK